MIEPLQRLVDRGAARWKILIFLEMTALAVSELLAYLWLAILLDNAIHLPVWGRVIAGGLFFAAVVWLGQRLIRSRRKLRLSEDEVALAIERQTPGGVQNRLINSLQLAKEQKLPVELGLAVVRENSQFLQRARLEHARRAKPAAIRVAVAALVVGIGLIFWGLRPEHFTNAATRILLPFARIAPIYRTTLTVEPGDVRILPGDDSAISVHIEGEIPGELAILHASGKRTAVPVKPGQRLVNHTFKAVEVTTVYAVRGNDYTTPFYRIQVPIMAHLSLLKGTIEYPAYTRCPSRQIESTSGSLEALHGSRASLTFVLDNSADSAALLLEKGSSPSDPKQAGDVQRVELKKEGPREFSCDLVFNDATGYRLETKRKDSPDYLSPSFMLRVVIDQPPQLSLICPDGHDEIAMHGVLQLGANAKDDYGLQSVGLFRRLAEGPQPQPGSEAGQPDWQPLKVWDVPERGKSFRADHALSIVALGAAEGDRLEIAPRAADTDPLKKGAWTTGQSRTLLIGGQGAALQVLYEQILATEAAVTQLVAGHQEASTGAAAWLEKLDPASGLNWSEQKNAKDVAAAMAKQSAEQQRLQDQAGKTAREMVRQAGNLRMSLAMLADTEMARSVRILEAVPKRENGQEMRAALADARITQQRIIRSLQEILGEYVQFRRDWELANMVPFLKMLSDRQKRMSEESHGLAAEFLQRSMARRQRKVLALTGLVQVAFGGMGQRTQSVGAVMADAFDEAATALDSSELKQRMQQAIGHLDIARGPEASLEQKAAGEALEAIYLKLKQAQREVSRQLIALLKDQLEAQKAIKMLRPGGVPNRLKVDEDKLDITDIVRMQKMSEENKKVRGPGMSPPRKWFEDEYMDILNPPDSGTRQNTNAVSLAKTPSGYGRFPDASDRQPNEVTPPIHEEFEDLVGDLLDELDDMLEDYDTYNLNAAFNINDPGDIQKMAGPLNSTAASAFTGNQKAPPHDFGGASRMGRQGARAHGMAVGNLSINRRGRDKALESQERIPDQRGVAKEIKSDDPQTDFATGVGGKRVESDDPSFFNTKNSGRWTDDIAKRMTRPKALHLMVERDGGPPMDPRVAEMLRDMESNQRQVIQRINALRKKLNNLYLPTDQLDEISRQLAENLDRLDEQPDPDVFRRRREALSRLRTIVSVIGQAASDFQPSLPREQVIRGRILHEPPRPVSPEYEETVKRFYEKLSGL